MLTPRLLDVALGQSQNDQKYRLVQLREANYPANRIEQGLLWTN